MTQFVLWVLLAAAVPLHATISALTTPTLSNPSPAPGDTVTIGWGYTEDYGADTRYMMAVSTQCAFKVGNSAGQTFLRGNSSAGCAPDGTELVATGCSLGTAATGTNTASVAVTLPATLVPGYTYYIIIGMGNYNVYANPNLTMDVQACVPFTIPLPAPYVRVTSVNEGSSAAAGGLVLYTLNYAMANVTNAAVVDVVPSNLTIVSAYNSGVVSGQTITWNFSGYTGSPVTGFVSFLARVNSGVAANTLIVNTPTATTGNGGTAITCNPSTLTVGGVGLTLAKSVTPSAAVAGNTLTYTMAYTTQGESMVEFQNFDSASMPSGWTNSSGGTLGNWTTANGYLESTGTYSGYPAMMDFNMTPIHEAVYIWDARVSSADTNHYDAVFRFNADAALTGFYMVRLNGSNKTLYLENVSGSGVAVIASVVNPHSIGVTMDTWYTLKCEVVCGTIKVKIWPRGASEPAAWDLNGIDNVYSNAGYAGFQANEGPAAYDNLRIFSLAGGTNVRIWDTVPAGTTYAGCSGGTGCGQSGGVVTWTVGGTCVNSGTVQLLATVNSGYACGATVGNSASIDSDDPPPAVVSNTVSTSLKGNCASPTPSRTPTPSPSQTVTRTASPLPSATPSATPTGTPSATRTATPTASPSATSTSTASPTFSATATVSPGPTATGSDTPTSTPSATGTATSSATATASPSSTPTATAEPSGTATGTRTPTATGTITPSATSTATATESFTATGTISPGPSPTDTDTPTATPSASCTGTPTPSSTASPTVSSSATPSLTGSPTETATVTPTTTATGTQTATATATPSFTATGTNTPGPSPTSSCTPTGTATATPTATATATPTGTPTPSGTPTASATGTQTATSSATPTATPSATASATRTASPTVSVTPTLSATFTVSPTFTPYDLSRLLQIVGTYPNPFEDRLAVYYRLKSDAVVTAVFYNVAGEKVRTVLADGRRGKNLLVWPGENNHGSRCSSGFYLLKLDAQSTVGNDQDTQWARVAIQR